MTKYYLLTKTSFTWQEISYNQLWQYIGLSWEQTHKLIDSMSLRGAIINTNAGQILQYPNCEGTNAWVINLSSPANR